MLDQLADYIERDIDARRKVSSALMYPGIIFVMSIVTVIILTGCVLPKFKTFFDSLNAKLPLTTRILLDTGHFLSAWWYLFVGVTVAAVVGGILMFRNQSGRAKLDAIFLRVPLTGDLVRHAILERFCRILGSMVRAGVPLPEAMVVTADATNNDVYRRGSERGPRGDAARQRGWPTPLPRPGSSPPRPARCSGSARTPARSTSSWRRRPIYYNRELDYKHQAVHQHHRAGGHRHHGCHRRLRGHGAGLGHVRHLPPGQGVTARPRSEEGSTLVEVIISVVILGIVTAGLLAGMTTTTASSNLARDQANAETALDQRGPGRNRRRPLSLSVLRRLRPVPGSRRCRPAGPRRSPSARSGTATALCPTSRNQCKGMQELTIQVSGPNGQPTWSRIIVKAGPGDAGDRCNERSLGKRIHAG